MYVFPVRLVGGSQNFTCDPVFVSEDLTPMNVSSVQWTRSLDMNGNSSLRVDSVTTTVILTYDESNKDNVTGYYVPAYILDNGTVVSNTLPILVASESAEVTYS